MGSLFLFEKAAKLSFVRCYSRSGEMIVVQPSGNSKYMKLECIKKKVKE